MGRPQRPDRRRPRRLLDLGCGLRAPFRGRSPRDLRRHPRARDGTTPQVRGLARGGDRGDGADRGLHRRRGRGHPRSGLRPPDLHGPARAAHPARESRPCRGLLAMTSPTVWQEVEFGSYGADLPVWVELAERTGGPVVELGAGAGRVALHLAGHGYEVVAVERDLELIRELEEGAVQRGVSLSVLAADLSAPADLKLPVRPALAS